MSGAIHCPPLESWETLLDSLPREQQERYRRHLESCPVCQERIEQAEEREGALRTLGRQLGDPTVVPADPTLSQFLHRLQEGASVLRTTSVDPVDLYFLRPSNTPGVLGTLGNYEVQEVIGQGGMGVVLKAFEPALHRLVAIKVMAAALAGSATARRRFKREAQAAAAVCHDNIVAVHGVHEQDGLPYLVMQYVAGESVQERLDRSGPLELVEIVRIGLQTASGLAAAHAQGLIHRDIKPANLLLENGLAKVKITDFGLARMSDDVGLTQNGVVAGTPEYMAPEQAREEAIDPRADLFSLGSVLYAMAAGRPPFGGKTTLAVLRRVSEQKPRSLRSLNPDIPAWLESFIARLLVKDPANRFQSAAEVAALLEGYLAHLRQPETVVAPDLLVETEPSDSRQSAGPARVGLAGWLRRPKGGALAGVALVGLVATLVALGQAQGPGQNHPAPGPELHKEFHQDFRGGRPLPPALDLVGPDADETARFEAEGLRIILPANRPVNQPVEVVAKFTLVGDFEITVAYELLSATQPASGYGVGVSLNVADNDQRNKFAKVARVRLVKSGSVFQSESWNNQLAKSYQIRVKPTESKSGRLRLVRMGPNIRYLAAEGPAGDFQEICQPENFGTEDLSYVHLVVCDSGKPGHAVDVRLLDFTVRATNLTPDPTADAAPAAEPQRQPGSRNWLAAAAIMGLLLLTPLVVYLIVRLSRSRKTPAAAPASEEPAKPEVAAPTGSVRCSGCRKNLKVKSELAGKKVKCPQCGQVIAVPGSKAARGHFTS